MKIDDHLISLRGNRSAQEDSYSTHHKYGAVYDAIILDGHRGDQVAKMASSYWAGAAWTDSTPWDRLREVHAKTPPGCGQGACAVAFHLTPEELSVANVGDTELYLVAHQHGEHAHYWTRRLSELHRTSNPAERERVLKAGAVIQPTWASEIEYVIDPQVGRGLMCSRSLGDRDYEHIGIISEPYMDAANTCDLPDKFWLVAATDGLWDVIKPAELPDFIAFDAEKMASRLVLEALGNRSAGDNITALVLCVDMERN